MSAETRWYAGRHVAVFGGRGLVGSALIRRLQTLDAAPARITSVSRRTDDTPMRDVHHVSASVLDMPSLASVPACDVAVFVVGATSDYLRSPIDTVRVGTEGFENFLRATQRCERRVLVSSARIYGPRPDQQPCQESAGARLRSPDLRNVYDGTKLVAEALALQASTEERRVTIARLANVYGPSESPSATVFGTFVSQALREKRVVVRGSPRSVRNHVHVDDVADALLHLAEFGASGAAYNVGSDDHVTTEQFARKIAAASPTRVEVEVESPDLEPDHMVLATDKLASIGFRSRRTLDQHLRPAVLREMELRS